MFVNFGFSKARSANQIVVELLAETLEGDEKLAAQLSRSNLSDEILENLVVVAPAPDLENFRFVFAGEGINRRFGVHLGGIRFQSLLQQDLKLFDCLNEFLMCSQERRTICSHRRIDFSTEWIVEYTRTITPVIHDTRVELLLAGYVFHDVLSKVSCF